MSAIAVLLCPVISAEYRTEKHFDEFSEYMNSDESPIRAENMKILKYSADSAEVYYYTPNSHGDVLRFTKTDGGWSYDSWDSYWSVSGNADRIIWPFWWHCMYLLLH